MVFFMEMNLVLSSLWILVYSKAEQNQFPKCTSNFRVCLKLCYYIQHLIVLQFIVCLFFSRLSLGISWVKVQNIEIPEL